jgi:hypothetical protein
MSGAALVAQFFFRDVRAKRFIHFATCSWDKRRAIHPPNEEKLGMPRQPRGLDTDNNGAMPGGPEGPTMVPTDEQRLFPNARTTMEPTRSLVRILRNDDEPGPMLVPIIATTTVPAQAEEQQQQQQQRQQQRQLQSLDPTSSPPRVALDSHLPQTTPTSARFGAGPNRVSPELTLRPQPHSRQTQIPPEGVSNQRAGTHVPAPGRSQGIPRQPLFPLTLSALTQLLVSLEGMSEEEKAEYLSVFSLRMTEKQQLEQVEIIDTLEKGGEFVLLAEFLKKGVGSLKDEQSC